MQLRPEISYLKDVANSLWGIVTERVMLRVSNSVWKNNVKSLKKCQMILHNYNSWIHLLWLLLLQLKYSMTYHLRSIFDQKFNTSSITLTENLRLEVATIHIFIIKLRTCTSDMQLTILVTSSFRSKRHTFGWQIK